MSSELVGILGLVVLMVLLFANMWIALSMALVGFLGYFYLVGPGPGFQVLTTVPFYTIAFYPVSCVPLFLLMGVIVSNCGVSGDLYNTAYKWVGQLRGGLAMATILACAGFAAISGSSTAGAVTMGKVALPEMKKYQYDDSMSTAAVASGGTLGILIPPSLGFMMYGILTEQPISVLFMAGILPGILLTLLFVLTVMLITAIRPQAGPAGPRSSFREKMVSLKNVWPMVILFLLVIGGIYAGIFTATEAGAVGAFGAIVITFAMRRLNGKNFRDAVLETATTTAMVLFLMVGAFIFMKFLAVSKLPFMLANLITGFEVNRYITFAVIIIIYIILGMFLDIYSAITLTIPIIYPVIIALGFDPIWYGVIMVLVMEMGLITPPVGLNVFALGGVTDVPMGTIFKGVWWFVGSILLLVVILTVFPVVATFIPDMM